MENFSGGAEKFQRGRIRVFGSAFSGGEAADCRDDGSCGGRFIQSEKVNVAESVRDQVDALRRGIGCSKFLDGLRISSDPRQIFGDFFWKGDAALGSESLDLPRIGNGHDSGNDGHGNADSSGSADKIIEQGIVEEELRDEKFGSRVDLALQLGQIRL